MLGRHYDCLQILKGGLETRHFEKNSNSRKFKTEGNTQNSKEKNPKTLGETQGFSKFHFTEGLKYQNEWAP